MKHTKHIIITLMLLVSGLSLAQPGKGRIREKIKAEKIAFFTEQLSLTETEAAKFWPIYNKHETEINEVKMKYLRPLKQKFRNDTDIPEADANKLLDELIIAENKMHQAKVNLYTSLKGSLPATKIIKLKAVEDAFNRKLLERLKQFRQKRKRD